MYSVKCTCIMESGNCIESTCGVSLDHKLVQRSCVYNGHYKHRRKKALFVEMLPSAFCRGVYTNVECVYSYCVCIFILPIT